MRRRTVRLQTLRRPGRHAPDRPAAWDLPMRILSAVSHGRGGTRGLPACRVTFPAESPTSPGAGPMFAAVAQKFWGGFPETGFSVTPDRLSSMRADTSACTGAMRKIL